MAATKTKAQIAAENKKAREKRVKFTESGKWIDFVTKKYGWLVNIYNTNGEVAQLVRDAYVNDWSDEEYTKAINNSRWYTNLQTGEYDYLKGTFKNDRAYLDKIDQQVQTVKSLTGQQGYTLSDEQSRLLAAGALKGGWDTTRLTSEIQKSVASQAKGGVSVAPTAPAEAAPTGLQKGTDAAGVRSAAAGYGLKLSDASVEGYVQAVLNGTMTADQVKSQFREQAKSLYPSLAKQLDSGDVASATASYRSIASTVLGVDESSVDFSDATKFGKLLTYQDPKTGEARLMNSTEWTQYLRGLPDWANTKEAKNQYSSMVDTVTKIFGKVR
jgi:hypothetical protein